MGPLIGERAVNKCKEHVQDAVRKGAKVVQGGDVNPDLGGNYFQPTVSANSTPASDNAAPGSAG